MTRREAGLVAVIVLLIGLFAGYALAQSGGDDGPDTAAGEGTSTTSTTSEAPTTTSTSTTSTSTTTSTTTTSTTTTSTTTTTTSTVPPPPMADVPSGQVAGFAIGSPLADVVDELITSYGPPDDDSGWSAGCQFDGSDGSMERSYAWGRLRVVFSRFEGPEILERWSWNPGPDDPTPGEVRLHEGVVATSTIAEISAVTGFATNYQEPFGLTLVTDNFTWIYLAFGESVDEPVFEISWGGGFCD